MTVISETRDATETADGRAPRKVPLRLITLGLLTAGLIALSVVVAVPFLHAITWGVALAIMGWPMRKLIKARVARPTVAASLSTLIVIAVIVVPGIFVAYQVGRETAEFADKTATQPDQLMSRE